MFDTAYTLLRTEIVDILRSTIFTFAHFYNDLIKFQAYILIMTTVITTSTDAYLTKISTTTITTTTSSLRTTTIIMDEDQSNTTTTTTSLDISSLDDLCQNFHVSFI